MRNKEQHEGKGKGWACNNRNMCNPIKKMQGGVTHVMIVLGVELIRPVSLHIDVENDVVRFQRELSGAIQALPVNPIVIIRATIKCVG